MSLISWFAQEYFAAVHKHDQQCQKKENAFCELLEVPQNQMLNSHYAELSNVQICEMGRPYLRGQYSDLFIKTKTGEQLYCEIKAMYKTWFRRNRRPYPAYLWSPFQDANKNHSAGFDLAKLATLPDANTTHIALIIIGSSLPEDRMNDDLDRFAKMAHIQTVPWESYQDYWPNQWHSSYAYDLRVWGCDTKNVPRWWQSIADIFCPYGYVR
jgi:hypothetical protein